MLIINRDFKLNFKKVAILNKNLLLNELFKILELPERHYYHSVLNRYYRKYPKVSFDIELAKKILSCHFINGSFFIIDYDEPFQGGYPKERGLIINEDELNNDSKINDYMYSNWMQFIETSKLAYWKNEEKVNNYLSLGDFHFFEDRPSKNIRESYLFEKKYNFFNLKEVNGYYAAIINLFYPDFKLIKKVSNNKIKRFAKKINNDFYLGLYVDFGFLEAELKRTYLELPKIKIEVFSDELGSHVKEDFYLKDQETFPIARIDLWYFMGNPINSRIGNSSEDENDLKKNLFYYFDIYSFYLKPYLRTIEKTLNQIMNVEN